MMRSKCEVNGNRKVENKQENDIIENEENKEPGVEKGNKDEGFEEVDRTQVKNVEDDMCQKKKITKNKREGVHDNCGNVIKSVMLQMWKRW